MNYYSAGDSWRMSFLLLSLDQQRAKVAELSRRGWSPSSLCGLTGWSPARIAEAIRTGNTTTTEGQQP